MTHNRCWHHHVHCFTQWAHTAHICLSHTGRNCTHLPITQCAHTAHTCLSHSVHMFHTSAYHTLGAHGTHTPCLSHVGLTQHTHLLPITRWAHTARSNPLAITRCAHTAHSPPAYHTMGTHGTHCDTPPGYHTRWAHTAHTHSAYHFTINVLCFSHCIS